MKREDLIALGVAEDVADKVLAEVNRELGEIQKSVDMQRRLADDYQQKYSAMESKYKDVDVDGLTKDRDLWKTRYEQSLKDKDKALNEARYDFALEDVLRNYEFSSSFARQGIKDNIMKKNLAFTDGKIEGIDDVMNELKSEYADAFKEVSEEPDTKGSTATTKPAKKMATGKAKKTGDQQTIDEYLDRKYKNNPFYRRGK